MDKISFFSPFQIVYTVALLLFPLCSLVLPGGRVLPAVYCRYLTNYAYTKYFIHMQDMPLSLSETINSCAVSGLQ